MRKRTCKELYKEYYQSMYDDYMETINNCDVDKLPDRVFRMFQVLHELDTQYIPHKGVKPTLIKMGKRITQ